MTVQIFLPGGSSQSYPNASGVQILNGFTIFYYKSAEETGTAQDKKVTTTLPILVIESVGTPRISTL